ncbi:MAG TPA: NRDE family protein [Burkholderiales bacterium]|nr:NRDE family protein [Burkholderiales bacterium]
MCLILLAAHAHPCYPLIVAANRDEAYDRPAAPAAFWDDEPRICAGRDLQHGGTWLGIACTGRFAAITNYRQASARATDKRSRGELTRNFLAGESSPQSYVTRLELRANDYNGFSLIVGNPESLWFYSNRGAGPQRISSGVHGLSNHLLDEPWPKVNRGIAKLEKLLGSEESELVPRLFDLLADRSAAPDDALPSTGVALERERALSASFIEGERYGTRASTVLLVAAHGHVLLQERAFGPGGRAAGQTEQRFRLDALAAGPLSSPLRPRKRA